MVQNLPFFPFSTFLFSLIFFYCDPTNRSLFIQWKQKSPYRLLPSCPTPWQMRNWTIDISDRNTIKSCGHCQKKKKATHEEWECVFVYVHEIQPQIYTQGVLVQLCTVSQHLGICLCSESNHMITYIVSIQTYSALLRLYFIMADRDKEIKHDINISWEKSVQKKAKTEWDRRAERGGNSKWKKRDWDQRQAAPMALCDKDIM